MATRVGTRERERAAGDLRRHFLSGRLSLDEFGDRVRLALAARDVRELRRATHGLPPVWRDGDEVRRVAREAKRRATVAAVKALWLVVSLVLLGALAGDASNALRYGIAWAVVSGLAWRAARRA